MSVKAALPPESPYKGLNPFEDSELDELLFFGRDREREIVVANLIASRLTVLYGPSGVGKSSLLHAAVARSLRELPEDPLVIVFSSWSDDPTSALAEAVGEVTGRATNGSAVVALEEAQADRDVYLVLDQAEEYFLYHADDGGPTSFAETLPALLEASLRINVLVSLREDSLAKLDRFTGRVPGLFSNTLRLDRLDRESARAAILRPAARYAELTGVSVSVEDELVERVLDEVGAGQIELTLGGQGVVEGAYAGARIEAPYLQLVMQRIWDEERAVGSTVLRAETLRRLGGAQHLVEEHLEGAMAELTDDQRDVAARLFNHLVTPSGTKIAHDVRDLAEFAGVPVAAVAPVLTQLTDRRILRSVEEGENVRYEIFHDVLALPVLAWRAGHEAERELQLQKRESDRRHRRLLAVIAAGAVLLAAMGAITAYALSQRNKAQDQAALASQNETEAQEQQKLAQQSANRAQQQEQLARHNAAEAQKQAQRASQNAAEAQQQKTRADENAQSASQNAAEAQRQSEVASQNAAEAQRQSEVASQNAATAQRESRIARAQRNRAQNRAQRARARALSNRAAALIPSAPAQSVELALAAVRLESSAQAESTLRNALASSRVRAVLPGGGGPVRHALFSPSGALALTVADRARLFDARTGRRLRTLPDPADVLAASFSPDGREVVTGDVDGAARLWTIGAIHRWAGASGPVVLKGHTAAIEAIAFSADGRWLLTVSDDRTAVVWDVATGQRLSTLRHDGPVQSGSFNPDASLVLTVSRSAKGARLFEARTGRLLRTFDERGVRSAVFGPDGSYVVTTSNDDTTGIWDLVSGKRLQTLRQPEGNVFSAVFSPDGTQLVTASRSSVYVWDTKTWQRSLDLVGPLNPVTAASFSPDGRFVVVSSLDRTARIYRTDDGFQVAVLAGHQDGLTDASFGPTNRMLVTASADGSARVWDSGVGDLLQVVGERSDSPLNRATFSPDGRKAVSANDDGTARILLVSKRRQLVVLRHEAGVNDAEFNPSGRLVVTASDDRSARIWRSDGTLLHVLPHDGRVLRAIFSPDGRLVATASDDWNAYLWRVADGKLVRTLRGHTDTVLDIAFSPDGKLIATGSDKGDTTARLWSIDGRLIHVLHHRGPVVRVAFSPDGRLLATASGDWMARLWRVRTGHLAHVLRVHQDFVRDVEFSRDGTRVVTASDDGDAVIWSVVSGRPIHTLRGHFNAVHAASFSPNGHWVVTAGPRTAGLWDAHTGQFFAPTGVAGDPFLRGPAGPGPLTSAAFAANGMRILTASADGTARTYLCDVCGGVRELVALARARIAALDRYLTPAERRRYLQA